MCAFFYIHVYIHNQDVYVCAFFYIHVYILGYIYVYVYIHTHTKCTCCIYIQTYTHKIYIHSQLQEDTPSICARIYISQYVSVHVCRRGKYRVCICVHIYIYPNMSVYMCAGVGSTGFVFPELRSLIHTTIRTY